MQLGEKARRDFFDKLNGQKISLYRRASFGYTIYDIPKLENTVMIEFEEYKSKLNDLKPKLEELRAAFVPQSLLDELERLHAMAEAPGFWDDPARSQKAVMRTKTLERKRDKFQSMCSEWDDLMTICEMALEENDDSMLEELTTGYAKLEADMEEARLETLLTGEYDANNALLSFHAGAGGTEAQDWAQMLYRMYMQWANKHGFEFEMLDYLDGDEAGIKSATIMIEGENAYGFLKGENGVHRLVRVSPFDANARRQTSFASLEVMPELDNTIQVNIRPEDIEMQVYRSSGAGGQHINKTSSAVRLIHKPTGIVVSCQTQRSQFQNRERCMMMLSSKLYQLEQERIESAVSSERRSQVGNGMRNEKIRTYNFPQSRVTDHRIGLTLYQLDSILNGGLDPILDALIAADQAEKLRRSESSDKS